MATPWKLIYSSSVRRLGEDLGDSAGMRCSGLRVVPLPPFKMTSTFYNLLNELSRPKGLNQPFTTSMNMEP